MSNEMIMILLLAALFAVPAALYGFYLWLEARVEQAPFRVHCDACDTEYQTAAHDADGVAEWVHRHLAGHAAAIIAERDAEAAA